MDSTPVDATKVLPCWGQFLHSLGRVTETRKNSSKMEISRRNEKKSSTFPGNSYPKSLKCSKIDLNNFDKIFNILKNLRVHRTNDSQLFRSLSPKSLSRDDPAMLPWPKLDATVSGDMTATDPPFEPGFWKTRGGQSRGLGGHIFLRHKSETDPLPLLRKMKHFLKISHCKINVWGVKIAIFFRLRRPTPLDPRDPPLFERLRRTPKMDTFLSVSPLKRAKIPQIFRLRRPIPRSPEISDLENKGGSVGRGGQSQSYVLIACWTLFCKLQVLSETVIQFADPEKTLMLPILMVTG